MATRDSAYAKAGTGGGRGGSQWEPEPEPGEQGFKHSGEGGETTGLALVVQAGLGLSVTLGALTSLAASLHPHGLAGLLA